MRAPASFARRVAAYGLDLAIVGLAAFPLVAWTQRDVPAQLRAGAAALEQRMWDVAGEKLFTGDLWSLATMFLADPAVRSGAEALAHTVLDAVVASLLTIVAFAAVWFVGFESSARHATPGKAALGLRVTDTAGAPPSFVRVAGRFVAGAASWAPLNAGHVIAAVRRDGRALHDLLAGTRVEQEAPAGTPLPAWARWWLAAMAAAFVAFPLGIVLRYVQLAAGAA